MTRYLSPTHLPGSSCPARPPQAARPPPGGEEAADTRPAPSGRRHLRDLPPLREPPQPARRLSSAPGCGRDGRGAGGGIRRAGRGIGTDIGTDIIDVGTDIGTDMAASVPQRGSVVELRGVLLPPRLALPPPQWAAGSDTEEEVEEEQDMEEATLLEDSGLELAAALPPRRGGEGTAGAERGRAGSQPPASSPARRLPRRRLWAGRGTRAVLGVGGGPGPGGRWGGGEGEQTARALVERERGGCRHSAVLGSRGREALVRRRGMFSGGDEIETPAFPACCVPGE